MSAFSHLLLALTRAASGCQLKILRMFDQCEAPAGMRRYVPLPEMSPFPNGEAVTF